MSPETMAQVFEPFFSTKPEGKGTGLGLSMVYGFAKQTGGHVRIYSELGQGTTIRMYLPRSKGKEDTEIERNDLPIVGGHEIVLVVEDDEGVRATVVEMLQELGYRVLKSSEAASALTVIESGVAIDLVFTDVVMPGPLKSSDLAKIAKQRLPNVGVLFTSGYTENSIVHGGRLDPGVQLLTKPYSREQLARTIRHVLDSRLPTSLETPVPEAQSLDIQATAGDTSKLTVLVVEDEVFIRMSTADMLDELGHSIYEAGSAEEALRLLEAKRPHVVVTDLGLPGMSGEEFCHEIRRRWPEIAIVFATGMDEGPILDDDSRTALLHKPFGVGELRAALVAAIQI